RTAASRSVSRGWRYGPPRLCASTARRSTSSERSRSRSDRLTAQPSCRSSGWRRGGGFLDCLHAEAHPALLVGLEDLDLHLLALFEVVGDVVDALVADLRNVEKPVLAWQKLHDRAEIQQLQHCAVVHPAYFDVGGDVLDAFLCREAPLGVDTGNRDGTIVGDFDRGSGLFLQRADHHAALAYHVADLRGIDLDVE